MDWWLLALAVACSVALAHHLGLVSKISNVIAEIASCCRCSVFWAVLGVMIMRGIDPVISLATSIVLAYATDWAGLALYAASKFYNKLWQRIKNRQARSHR